MEHLPAFQQHLRLLQGLREAPKGSTAVHTYDPRTSKSLRLGWPTECLKKKKRNVAVRLGVGGWGMGGQKAVLETQLSR